LTGWCPGSSTVVLFVVLHGCDMLRTTPFGRPAYRCGTTSRTAVSIIPLARGGAVACVTRLMNITRFCLRATTIGRVGGQRIWRAAVFRRQFTRFPRDGLRLISCRRCLRHHGLTLPCNLYSTSVPTTSDGLFIMFGALRGVWAGHLTFHSPHAAPSSLFITLHLALVCLRHLPFGVLIVRSTSGVERTHGWRCCHGSRLRFERASSVSFDALMIRRWYVTPFGTVGDGVT